MVNAIIIGNCIAVGAGSSPAVPSVPEFRFSVNSAGTGTSAANQFTIPINAGTFQRFAFQGCSNLVVNATDTGDFSQVSNFQRFWYGTNTTTFPLIDFSSATNLSELFRSTPIATFPANAFDNTAGNQYSNAFTTTNLTTQSIDNILVSIDASGADGSFNTFKQSGGQAPSATGIAAKDSLVAKGWTIVITTQKYEHINMQPKKGYMVHLLE